MTGGIHFDFGNSPTEYTASAVRNRALALTTTNGTRALRATLGSHKTFVASFLNLDRTAEALRRLRPARLLVIGSGTYEEAAFEDTLAAGALCAALSDLYPPSRIADSAMMARLLYRQSADDLYSALAQSRNGHRLLQNSQLRDDVGFAAQRNAFPILACLGSDGIVRAVPQ